MNPILPIPIPSPALQLPVPSVSPGPRPRPPTGSESTASPTLTVEPADASPVPPPSKKRQKRNKPTLSCEECVERKTKCDRARPTCLACIKRQSGCKYAHIANILVETNRSIVGINGSKKSPTPNYPTKNCSEVSRNIRSLHERSISRGSVSSYTGLLSHVPYSHPSASNVFGIGSEHPFANHWTCQGGLPEVITVLPEKVQADILLERYFECVDPVYPMLHRQTFYTDYDMFCALDRPEKDKSDGSFVALIFAMLALGTQFVTNIPPKERQQSAEFCVSAAHQALRMASYMNKPSVRSVQAMVLITYFLINDNHASDGWAFSGILIRQAYALGLHRDPNIVVPDATSFEKQSRLKLWQAVLLQDTFLTVLLSLPPSATHTDVSVTSLFTDDTSSTDTAYINLSWRLASLVQHSVSTPRSLDLPLHQTPLAKTKLLQQFHAIHNSFPPSFLTLSLSPITPNPDINMSPLSPQIPHQATRAPLRTLRQTLFLTSNYHHNIMLLHSSSSLQLLQQFHAIHNSFPPSFLTLSLSPITPNPDINMSPLSPQIPHQATRAPLRTLRQTLFLTSNYHHNIMLLHSSSSLQVAMDIPGALDAAHFAIHAFFKLWEVFRAEAKVWWVFNHRAFLEALCIGGILKGDDEDSRNQRLAEDDPLFVRGREDIVRMIDIMRQMSEGEHGSKVALTRISVLSAYI
ncbi:hypothetical protein HYFRA_00007142 [Hymenoscyphus fraxineus]|uniref:Zn(2)-C6 fungal-type domain-containing protein n=1 Tax=Hymenoscyphus fraxineus TaxID=746836 RepID=A0A9N9L029_9HELO|nr:hypothetical protein HYFRA_00007142 [Hymenoscyphus fraxineus]